MSKSKPYRRTNESDFLDKIRSNPNDHDLRLVYSDWLSDQGREKDAENQRARARFSLHVEKYANGCGAIECIKAQHICLARGVIESDILFTGEAPGESEDSLSQPFVGPAGLLLDQMVKEGVPNHLRVCFTNMVGCIPREEDGGKLTQPDDSQVYACAPRLQEFIRIANPRLIIAVGNFARDWLDTKRHHHIEVKNAQGDDIPKIDILHPAYILRARYAMRGILVQKTVLAISNACEEYLGDS